MATIANVDEAVAAFSEWIGRDDVPPHALRIFREVASRRTDVANDLLRNGTNRFEQQRQAFAELLVASAFLTIEPPFILKPAIVEGKLELRSAADQEVSCEFAVKLDARWIAIEVKTPEGDVRRENLRDEFQRRFEKHRENGSTLPGIFVVLDDAVRSVWLDMGGLGKVFASALSQAEAAIPAGGFPLEAPAADLTYKGRRCGQIFVTPVGPARVGIGGPNQGTPAARPRRLKYAHKLADNVPNVLVITFLDNLDPGRQLRLENAFAGAFGTDSEFQRQPNLSAIVFVLWDSSWNLIDNPHALLALTESERQFFARDAASEVP